MDWFWFREAVPQFSEWSSASPLQVRCGGRVLRGGDEDQVHCLVICIRPATSTAPASRVRPTLVQCLDRCTSHHLAAGAGAGLGSGTTLGAIGLQHTEQCTGGAQNNPDIATRSHAQDGCMPVLSSWCLGGEHQFSIVLSHLFIFFIPKLLERPKQILLRLLCKIKGNKFALL